MNPAIGEMVCPISAATGKPHQATVHREASKRANLYFRCDCGTIQPRTDTGQMMMARLAELYQPARDGDKIDEAKLAAASAVTETLKVEKKKQAEKVGLFDGWAAFFSDEESGKGESA